MSVHYILACDEPEDLRFIQLAVLMILNPRYGCIRCSKMCILDITGELIRLAPVPFCIHKTTDMFLKAKRSISGSIFQLVFQFCHNCSQSHSFQGDQWCSDQFCCAPPL